MNFRRSLAVVSFRPELKTGMRGGGERSRNPEQRTFRPGDTVRQSGIYEVLHERDHRAAHEAVMVSGDQYPSCDLCDDKVRFRLSRAATYIFHDEDFEEFGG